MLLEGKKMLKTILSLAFYLFLLCLIVSMQLTGTKLQPRQINQFLKHETIFFLLHITAKKY